MNTNEQLAAAIVRANERLDWIEARDGKLPDNNYATIETTVGVVRALRGDGVNTTQPADLMPAWEAFNTSLAALIESANGEYLEQRRFSAFEAGWRAGGMASVDATLRDTLVQEARKRIEQLENDLEHALASVGAFRQAIEDVLEKSAVESGEDGFVRVYLIPVGVLHRAIGMARGTDAGGALLAKLAASEQRAAAWQGVAVKLGDALIDLGGFDYVGLGPCWCDTTYSEHDEDCAIAQSAYAEYRAALAAAAPSAGAEGA